MEQKRKQKSVNGVTEGGRRTKPKGDERTATDAEVEEFFSILRQLHSSVRHIRSEDNRKGGDRAASSKSLTEKGSCWKPVFECSDFEEFNNNNGNSSMNNSSKNHDDDDHRGKNHKERVEENNLGFDLNVEPDDDDSGTKTV